MLMVIFGAGASNDSDPRLAGASADFRPPLTDGLFDYRFGDAIDRYPDCSGIVPELRRPFVESNAPALEQLLDQFYRQAYVDGDDERLIQLAAVRYYLRWVGYWCASFAYNAKGITNYVDLIDKIRARRELRDEPVALVSFNYDTLLEMALQRVLRLELFYAPEGDNQLTKYVTGHPMFQVFKPHGSWHWMREVTSPPEAQVASPLQMIREAKALKFGERYGFASGTEDVKTVDMAAHVMYPAFPSLAVPLREKLEFSWPPNHQSAFEALLPKVTHLIVIGWRAQEKHFLDLWAEKSAVRAMQVISGTAAGAIQVTRRLETAGIRGRVEGYAGFSSYMATLRLQPLDDFLRT